MKYCICNLQGAFRAFLSRACTRYLNKRRALAAAAAAKGLRDGQRCWDDLTEPDPDSQAASTCCCGAVNYICGLISSCCGAVRRCCACLGCAPQHAHEASAGQGVAQGRTRLRQKTVAKMAKHMAAALEADGIITKEHLLQLSEHNEILERVLAEAVASGLPEHEVLRKHTADVTAPLPAEAGESHQSNWEVDSAKASVIG